MAALIILENTIQRSVFVLVITVLFIAGCATSPAAAPTAPATAPATTAVPPTPAPVWRDKLSGIWVSSNSGNAAWTVDLDDGTINFVVNGTSSSNPGKISFDHEEGKTVFVRFEAFGQNPAHTDAFRFLNDDVVVWEQDGKKIDTWQRKK